MRTTKPEKSSPIKGTAEPRPSTSEHRVPRVLSASTVLGTTVENLEREKLGHLKELMFDTHSSRIAYAVLSFGGFLGMGDKLFAIPWAAFNIDPDSEKLVLNVDKEVLKDAPGFDKNDWPEMADLSWGTEIHRFYGYDPYWE